LVSSGEKKTTQNLKLCTQVSFLFKKLQFIHFPKINLNWYKNSDIIYILNANLSELLKEANSKVIIRINEYIIWIKIN
jgi:hypothetical protein